MMVEWWAAWTETRDVTGVVYAASKAEAERRIRSGEGITAGFGAKRCSAPRIRGKRNPTPVRMTEAQQDVPAVNQ